MIRRRVPRSPFFVLLAGLLFVRPAGANNACEDIDGNVIILGEARYETNTGTDVSYANLYWAESPNDELKLHTDITDASNYIGGALTTATNLSFWAYGYAEDSTASDHTSAVFTLRLQRSTNSDGQHCPGDGQTDTTDTLTIDTTTNADFLYGGKLLGRSGMSWELYWKATLTVHGDTNEVADKSESGCFVVLSDAQCDFENY